MRWNVPGWFIGLVAGLLAILSVLGHDANKHRIAEGAAVLAALGVLASVLQINLIWYHNRALSHLDGLLRNISADAVIADVQGIFPFQFSRKNIWFTATFWVLVATIVITGACVWTAVRGPFWLH
jgi:hypothetical protein